MADTAVASSKDLHRLAGRWLNQRVSCLEFSAPTRRRSRGDHSEAPQAAVTSPGTEYAK